MKGIALAVALLLTFGCALASRLSKDDLRAFKFDRTVKCPEPFITNHWTIDGEGNVSFFSTHHHRESENVYRTKMLDEAQVRQLVAAVRRSGVASTKQNGPYGQCMDCCWSDIEIETTAGEKTESLTFEGYLDIDEGWRKLNLRVDDLAGLDYF